MASASGMSRSCGATRSDTTLVLKVEAANPIPPIAQEMPSPSAQATSAPIANANPAVITDSARNAVRIEPREKPSARNVPISEVRACTAAYMVLVAPNIAPMPASTASPATMMYSVFAVDDRLS